MAVTALEWLASHLDRISYMKPLLLHANVAAGYSTIIIYWLLLLRLTLLWQHGYCPSSSSRYNLQRGDLFGRVSWLCVVVGVAVIQLPIQLLNFKRVGSGESVELLFSLVSVTMICLGGVFKLAQLGIGKGANKTILLPYLAIPTLSVFVFIKGWL